MMGSDASLLILGSGGHAKSLIDAIEHQGKYRIAGLVSLNQSDSYRKYRVIGRVFVMQLLVLGFLEQEIYESVWFKDLKTLDFFFL